MMLLFGVEGGVAFSHYKVLPVKPNVTVVIFQCDIKLKWCHNYREAPPPTLTEAL